MSKKGISATPWTGSEEFVVLNHGQHPVLYVHSGSEVVAQIWQTGTDQGLLPEERKEQTLQNFRLIRGAPAMAAAVIEANHALAVLDPNGEKHDASKVRQGMEVVESAGFPVVGKGRASNILPREDADLMIRTLKRAQRVLNEIPRHALHSVPGFKDSYEFAALLDRVVSKVDGSEKRIENTAPLPEPASAAKKHLKR